MRRGTEPGDVYHGFTKYGRVEDVMISMSSNCAWVFYKTREDGESGRSTEDLGLEFPWY